MTDRKKRTSDLAKAVKELVALYGGFAYRNSNQPRINPKGQPYYPDKSAIGSPDIIAVMPKGVTLWLELKVSPDTLRETQIAFKAELEKRGHIYIVVTDTIDELACFLDAGKKIGCYGFTIDVTVAKKPESEG